MRRPSSRALVLGLAVICLAILAGFMATRALATSDVDTYCSGCTLGSTPAVSDTHNFTANHIRTQANYYEQIYYYDATHGENCSAQSTIRVSGIDLTCTINAGTTARCHLDMGDGPTSDAMCWADYPA